MGFEFLVFADEGVELSFEEKGFILQLTKFPLDKFVTGGKEWSFGGGTIKMEALILFGH